MIIAVSLSLLKAKLCILIRIRQAQADRYFNKKINLEK